MPEVSGWRGPLTRRGKISAAACAIGLVVGYSLAPLVFNNDFIETAIGDLVPLAIIAAISILALRNALDSNGHTRLFWGLVTLSMSMWCLNLLAWVWFEVWLRQPVPDPYFGDIVLFLHVVPMMAAVALGLRNETDDQGRLSNMLTIGMLLVWWMALYAFVVLPDEYVVTNRAVYSWRWDVLYLTEGLMMIALSGRAYLLTRGTWRNLYRDLFIANAAYSTASVFINAAIRNHTYKTGGLWDVPFLLSALYFLWAVLSARSVLPALQAEIADSIAGPDAVQSPSTASFLARIAMLSLPCMAYWAMFMSHASYIIRQVRFDVAIGSAAILMLFVFLKQNLLDERLILLLGESRRSYVNLERLQNKVVQQEKLASLGELVSLGASELQQPLSAVLESSEALVSGGQLNEQQLLMAQKIGQQARRTRDLVHDLLSFAQQVPGDKVSLDVKPLLQRALQMEGFKLENRDIHLELQSEPHLPHVLGNSNQLLQAFLQVVENAAEAMQNTGKGRLLISIRRESGDVVIEFVDNGPGLKNPERVFDPFYTTKPVGKGTGLGLSATYGVIKDHKGQITCHNAVHGGAVFEVRLPGISPAPLSQNQPVATGQPA